MNSKQIITIWSRVLDQTLAGKSEAERKKIVRRLEGILKRKKKEYLLSAILENVDLMIKKRETLEMTLSREQPRELMGKLEKNLESCFNGWKEIDVKIDSSIIGGFIAKTDQYLVDASVKNCLAQLKQKFEQ